MSDTRERRRAPGHTAGMRSRPASAVHAWTVPPWLHRRVLMAADVAAVAGAWWLAVAGDDAVRSPLAWTVAGTVVTLLLLGREQVYLDRVRSVPAIEVLRIGRACALATVLVALAAHVAPTPPPVARLVLATVAAAATVVAVRAVLHDRLIGERVHDGAGRSLLLVGRPEAARRTLDLLERRPQLGYRVLGYLSVERATSDIGIPWLGHPDDLAIMTDLTAVAGVIIVADGLDERVLSPALSTIHALDVHAHVVVDDGAGEPQIRMVPLSARSALDADLHLSTWQRKTKRAFDLVVGTALTVLALPVVVAAAVAVRLVASGPVLVRDTHVGPLGEPLPVLRLRTRDLPDTPAARAVAHACRALCIDELPQLALVLRGSMSLVGPRPLRPGRAGDGAPVAMHAGLFGLRHIEMRGYPAAGPHRRADQLYAQHWSPGLDLSILVTSVGHVLWRMVRGDRDDGRSTPAVT